MDVFPSLITMVDLLSPIFDPQTSFVFVAKKILDLDVNRTDLQFISLFPLILRHRGVVLQQRVFLQLRPKMESDHQDQCPIMGIVVAKV